MLSQICGWYEKCDICGKENRIIKETSYFPKEEEEKELKQKGWLIGTASIICPACRRRTSEKLNNLLNDFMKENTQHDETRSDRRS